jgi:hypothetical protein
MERLSIKIILNDLFNIARFEELPIHLSEIDAQQLHLTIGV